ncbi:O-antigen ligase family protein [Candidatus Uhrbacteria bacterium]|nr:O-antigen ligase family protein [Candidatus Uhrbacteria bacterium]
MIAFGFIATVLFGVLAWRDLKTTLLFLVAAAPIYLWRFDVLGIPTTMLEVWVWIFFAAWVIRSLKEKPWRLARCTPSAFLSLRLPITVILAAGILSLFIAPDFFAALGILKAYFVEPLILFVALVSILKRDDLPRLLAALAGSVLVLSLGGLAQTFTGLGIPAPWDIEGRITSVFAYPNALGLFVAPIISALLVFGRKPRAFFVWAIAFGINAIVAAETEAALVAIPASLVLVAFLSQKKSLRTGVLAIGVAFLLAVLLSSSIKDKVTLRDWSGEVRRSQWSETWIMLTDEPVQFIFGAGLSGYPRAIEPYHKDTRFEIFQYPHNIFLNIWVELGLLGLLGFLLLAYTLAKIVWRHRQDRFVLAGTAALLTMFVHGLVDVPYFKNDLAILTWSFVAVIILATHKPETV